MTAARTLLACSCPAARPAAPELSVPGGTVFTTAPPGTTGPTEHLIGRGGASSIWATPRSTRMDSPVDPATVPDEPGKVCTCTKQHCAEERCPVCRDLDENAACPASLEWLT